MAAQLNSFKSTTLHLKCPEIDLLCDLYFTPSILAHTTASWKYSFSVKISCPVSTLSYSVMVLIFAFEGLLFKKIMIAKETCLLYEIFQHEVYKIKGKSNPFADPIPLRHQMIIYVYNI